MLRLLSHLCACPIIDRSNNVNVMAFELSLSAEESEMKYAHYIMLIILPLVALAGCPNGNSPNDAADEHEHADEGGHSHGVHGPNGGHIFALGTPEYHAEMGTDLNLGAVGVHILGNDAKTAKPIPIETITLVETKDGETIEHTLTAPNFVDEASFFQLQNAELAERVARDENFSGRLEIKFGDQDLSGEVQYVGHDH